MCRRVSFAICILLAVLSAPVHAARWTGGGDGTSWYDSDNWDPNVPGQYEDVDINSPPSRGPIIDGDVECGVVRGPSWDSDVNQVMDILSGSIKINGMWRFKNGGTGPATVNISGGDISVGEWRWSDGTDTYATVNVTGGTVACARIKVGDDGGGELNISGGATVSVATEVDFSGNAPSSLTINGGSLDIGVRIQLGSTDVKVNLDAGTLHCAQFDVTGAYAVDINEGMLIIDGNVVPKIESDIAEGYITAFDDTSDSEVHVEWDAETDQTTVWATTIYTWARHPSPENGTENLCTGDAELTWMPGVYAAEHDVYFGTDYDDVKWAVTVSPEYRVRQEPNSYDASVLETLVPGETYYWRIDEVNDNAWAPSGSPWKGRVWSFSINDGNVFEPYPAHSETGVPLDVVLSWMPGCGAVSHKVYFGTSWEDVNSMTDPCATPSVGNESYNPGTLDYLTEYYWRVDEVNGPTTLKGPVWKFRSQSAIVDVNMVLWYKFDETGGMTAGDSSGYEKHASAVGTQSVEWDPNGGRFDGCIQFTESEAFSVPSDALAMLNSAVTVSLWFNIDAGASLGADYVMFDAGDLGSGGSNKLIALVPDAAGDVVWRAGSDPCDVLAWTDATPGAWKGDWHHFGFRKNEAEGTMTVFFDGLPVESRAGTNTTLASVVGKPFVIGCYNNDNSGDYGGRMDDFRVFNRALSDVEVASLFRGGEVELAWAPSPYDGQIDVPRDVNVTWWPGEYAVEHKVFFGTSYDDVNDMSDPCSTQSVGNEEYDPGLLALDTQYFWRIDEVNGPNTWKGPVWRFRVASFIVIDNFEQYDTSGNRVYNSWCDQRCQVFEETGSWLTLSKSPLYPVHTGDQSVEYWYNCDDFYAVYYYAEAWLPLEEAGVLQDWTSVDVRLLTLFFYGDPINDANQTEQMYVSIEDTAGKYAELRYGDGRSDESMSDLLVPEWQSWDIPFVWFNDSNAAVANDVNLASVARVYIGFGNRRNPVPGGEGWVNFDDIRLSLPICRPEYGPAADFSGNCIVDIADVGIMGEQWLRRDVNFLDDLGIQVQQPLDSNLVGHWKLDEGTGTFAEDSSVNNYDGTLESTDEGGYSWVAGHIGSGAVEFGGGRMYVDDGGSTPTLRPVNQVSVSAWIYILEPMSSARCVVKGRNDYETYELEFNNDDQFIFTIRDPCGTRFSLEDGSVWPGGWIHVAGTYDGNAMTSYVNGEIEDTADISNPYGLSQDTNGLAIGNKARGDANDTPFEGIIDDVRVYDYGLSQAEVAWLATEGTGVFLLDSPVNMFSGEDPEVINFKDFAKLLESWLDEKLWPAEVGP